MLLVAAAAVLPLLLASLVAYGRWHALSRPWMFVTVSALLLYAAAFYLAAGILLKVGIAGQPSPAPISMSSSVWFRPTVIWLMVAPVVRTVLAWAFRK